MEARLMSGAALAYIGDAVFELMVREYMLEHGSKQPDRLHRHTTALVNAAAQSAIAGILMEYLTEEEQSIYRRGRNASTVTSAKHQTIGDYRRATGLEALFGFLYLEQRQERMQELFLMGIERFKTDGSGAEVSEPGNSGADGHGIKSSDIREPV